MSLVLVDSWDYLATAQLPGLFTSNGSMTQGFEGSDGYVAATSVSHNMNFTIPSPASTYIVKLRVKWASSFLNDDRQVIFRLANGATIHCGLVMNGYDGHLYFFRSSTTTLIGAFSTKWLREGIWYDIECKVTIGDAGVGSIECRVNGETWIGPTVVDSRNGATSTADTLTIGPGTGTGIGGFRYSHVILCDTAGAQMNDWLGCVDVATSFAASDGAHTAWTIGAGSGSDYQQVDDPTADGDTTYLNSATLNAKSSFNFAALPAGVTAVKSVTVAMQARKDDATARALTQFIRIGGVDYSGAAKTMTTSYVFYADHFELDPSSSTVWNVGADFPIEAGVEVTT